MKKKAFYLASILVVIVSGIFFLRMLRHVDWVSLWLGLQTIQPLYLVSAATAVFLVLPLCAWMWQVFLPTGQTISFWKLLEIISVWSMGINTLPFYGGQPMAIYLLVRLGKIKKSTAFSVLALDQIMEGLARLPIFAVVIWATPLPSWMSHGMKWALGIVISCLCVLVFFAFYFRDAGRKPRVFKFHWINKGYHLLADFAHQLQTLRSVTKLSISLLLGILMKFCLVGAIYLVQRGFQLDLPLWTSFFILSALFLTTMVPVSPGNLGVFEATVFFIYKYLGVDEGQSMALALVHHLIYLLPLILPGYFYSLKIGWGKTLSLRGRPRGVAPTI